MEKKRIGFWICSALVFLLMLAILELNQNTLWGWLLICVASAVFWFLQARFLKNCRWYLRLASWLVWLAVFSGILLLTWPPVRPVPAAEHSAGRTEIVTVSGGGVRGVLTEDGSVEVFAGIPYAQPPVGELRWCEPVPAEPWEGVLEADHFGPMSMQPTNLPIYNSLTRIVGYHDYRISLRDNYTPPVSEDSLYLNIWRPADGGRDLPVLVYVHGGSLQTGQPWYGDYSGEGLAREGIIVVNMAYRLGVFGFFADEGLSAESPHGTTGNYGLLDQILALRWVQENIAAFGGDPGNVTLAGESAGSASVSALCASPLASGLFRRAVLESSTVVSAQPPHSFRLMDEALESGTDLLARHACASAEELRRVPAAELVQEAYTQHHITVDGYVLSQLPRDAYLSGNFNESAILHGYNSEESGPFILFSQANLSNYEEKVRGYFGPLADEVLALYPAKTDREARDNWAEIFGAAFFDYPHYCLNRLAAEQGIPVWEYCFSRENGRLGPWHSGEEIYLYGNLPASSPLFNDRDYELSRQMLSYFANFCRTGDPNGEGLPRWEQNFSSEDLMGFGDETSMIRERKTALYEILDRMTGWT